MEQLTLDALDAQADTFDALLNDTADIDQFCSSTAWILPAHAALMPRRSPWLWASEHGYVALAKGFEARVGHYLQPLEAMWNFASGIVSVRPERLLRDLAGVLEGDPIPWNMALFSGIIPESAMFRAIVQVFGARRRVGAGLPTVRYRASLEGGEDGFLGRRSRKFRANLRRVQRKAEELGVGFDKIHDATPEQCAGLYERILRVEARSWKGLDRVGINVGGMREFYRLMLPRLARHGALRITFAQHEGRDVAYILGGIRYGAYRGLQMSFDDACRSWSLGNLLQAETVRDVCAEGARLYDLGCEIEYKAYWSDSNLTTMTVAVFR